MADDVAYQGDLDDIVIGPEADAGGYVLLPPGVYPFTIDEPIEREQFSGSAKLPPCWKVTVKLNVDGDPIGKTTIFYNLFVTKNQAWKIKQLFVGVGLVDASAETFTPPWNQLPGTMGVVELGDHEHEGKKYNDVKKVLSPIEGAEAIGKAMAAETAAPATQTPTFNYPK